MSEAGKGKTGAPFVPPRPARGGSRSTQPASFNSSYNLNSQETEDQNEWYGEDNENEENGSWGSKYQQESQYFDSYSHMGIHEEMLKDFVRTNAYQQAILQNSDQFRQKVVLDVGCGTSILSIFCVRAGAKKVYAIDASDIADVAKKIVEANHLSDKIVYTKGSWKK
jgi:2-polyprenyl-3-methyl-5-hydroxy-6-metoxy-1,4-benzoquinol methylase